MGGSVCMFILRELASCPPAWNHAESLAGRGLRVMVLQPRARGKDGPLTPKGVETVGISLIGRRLPSTRGLVLKYAEYLLRAIRKGEASRPEVCVGHDLDGLLPAARVAKAAGARLVYHAHELWTERSRVPGLALWRRLEPRLLAQCDLVIVPSPERARYYQTRYGVKAGPLVVRNCPRLRAPVSPGPDLAAELERQGVRPETRIVLYQGGLGDERCTAEVVEAARLLPGELITVLVGPVARRFGAKLERLLREGAGRVVYLPRRSPEALWPLTCRAQVGLALYRPTSLNNRLCAPNKVFEYLMAGLSVVASAGESMESLLVRRGLGVTADPEDPRAIAEAIGAACALRREPGFAERAKEAVATEFNWAAQSGALLRAYDELLRDCAAGD